MTVPRDLGLYELTLPAHPSCAAIVRRFAWNVAQLCGLDGDLSQDVELASSEAYAMVASMRATLEALEAVRVTISVGPVDLRVEVEDRDPRLPRVLDDEALSLDVARRTLVASLFPGLVVNRAEGRMHVSFKAKLPAEASRTGPPS